MTLQRPRAHIVAVGLVVTIVLAACGAEEVALPATSSPNGNPATATTFASISTADPAPLSGGTTTASPESTVAPTVTQEPLRAAQDTEQALANLEQAMTRPGHLAHLVLTQVNTDAMMDPERVEPVWSAEAWIDVAQGRSRTDYEAAPVFRQPFMQPGTLPLARTTIHAAGQAYRAYNEQVWVTHSASCFPLDRPLLAVAFICDLSSHPWVYGDPHHASEEESQMRLTLNVDFEGHPAIALSVDPYYMTTLYLDAETYLPLGWTSNMMESGTLVTTIAIDFVPTATIAADLLDPISIGFQPGPPPTGRILVRREILRDVYDPEVVVINLDGSAELNLSNHVGRDIGAVWSPDGQRVAFTSERDGNTEVYVINADGTGLTNLTNNPAPDGIGLAWSPDGTRIVFGSDRDGTNLAELYVMDADGSNVIRLSPLDYIQWPAWSPDGERIVFASGTGIHVANADGSGQALLATMGNAAFPSWTPDGSRIVFSSSQTGASDIFVVNSDGSGLKNLTDDPADDSMPVVSPDGQRILFYSDRGNRGYTRDAYVMNIDGSQPMPLASLPSMMTCETGCSWSPDGAYVVATLLDPVGMSSTLVVVSADAAMVSVLTGVNGASPQWSP